MSVVTDRPSIEFLDHTIAILLWFNGSSTLKQIHASILYFFKKISDLFSSACSCAQSDVFTAITSSMFWRMRDRGKPCRCVQAFIKILIMRPSEGKMFPAVDGAGSSQSVSQTTQNTTNSYIGRLKGEDLSEEIQELNKYNAASTPQLILPKATSFSGQPVAQDSCQPKMYPTI